MDETPEHVRGLQPPPLEGLRGGFQAKELPGTPLAGLFHHFSGQPAQEKQGGHGEDHVQEVPECLVPQEAAVVVAASQKALTAFRGRVEEADGCQHGLLKHIEAIAGISQLHEKSRTEELPKDALARPEAQAPQNPGRDGALQVHVRAKVRQRCLWHQEHERDHHGCQHVRGRDEPGEVRGGEVGHEHAQGNFREPEESEAVPWHRGAQEAVPVPRVALLEAMFLEDGGGASDDDQLQGEAEPGHGQQRSLSPDGPEEAELQDRAHQVDQHHHVQEPEGW